VCLETLMQILIYGLLNGTEDGTANDEGVHTRKRSPCHSSARRV